MNFFKAFKNGVFKENPIFVQVIGMCPTLAVTTSAINGIGMGLSTTVVLLCSNIIISLIRKWIPDSVRIPSFIVVIAAFVTIVQLCLKAFLPALDSALGIYIPLIVVNCIILARAESFAFRNGVIASMGDGIGNGIGFTIALTLVGFVREILGSGTVFNMPALPAGFPITLSMIMAPGAFFTLGCLMAAINHFKNKSV